MASAFKTFLLLISLMSVRAYGLVASSAGDYCLKAAEAKEVFHGFVNKDHRMSFSNSGGLLDRGVCWWHSRFQRNAIMLTYYPGGNLPTAKEAKKIIKKIRRGTVPVAIPWFQNFFDFTNYFKVEVMGELDNWQWDDGVYGFSWIDGLSGETSERASELRRKMDSLYAAVEISQRAVFQMLQIRGIAAHSWLVISVEKNIMGMELMVIDSNYPGETTLVQYNYGSTGITYRDYDTLVPYTMYDRDWAKIKNGQERFCKFF